MFSTKKHLVPDAEVKVQKVKKIEPVSNLVTRPMVYANPTVVTVKKRPPEPAAYSPGPGGKKIDRMLSAEDIDHYIKMKKEQFQQGETERTSSSMFRNSRKFSQKHSLG